jgi:holliday junction DNA helicase RuvB
LVYLNILSLIESSYAQTKILDILDLVKDNSDMIIKNNDTKQDEKDIAKKVKKPIESEIKKLETEEDEVTLRPRKLDEIVGQEMVVRQLKLIIDSAKIREKLPEHILFYGQPGLGKTTMANLISNEMNANFRVITAPSLQKIGDLVSILVGLEPNTVLFIDEIHRLKLPLEESLYSAMEDGQVDLIMGKGNGISTLRMDLNPFVLIGATTQLGKISKPLKDRFPTVFQLQSYNSTDMFILIERSSDILKLKLDDDSKFLIAQRSRGVPRVANNILKRLLDYQTVHKMREVNLVQTTEFFEELGVFDQGLTRSDLKYLDSLKDGSLGLKTIASIMMEDPETIELVIEPYLIHLGFIEKSSEGRNLTLKGVDKLKKLNSKIV